MEQYNVIATSTFGIEGIVGEEVKALGFKDVKVENGKVEYKADGNGIARSNLWLRCADRVFIKLGEFKAETFEELFDETNKIPWEKYIPEDGEFIINAKSVKSKLFSLSDCQRIVKKSVAKRLSEHYKVEWLKETGDKFPVLVSILKDIVTINLDTSGDGLHKRGYREMANSAPMKETLAASIVKISRWNEKIPLIDPMCGTGTILIEAAMIGRNIAPGIGRKFISENWSFLGKDIYKVERKNAYDAIKYDLDMKIKGYDIDSKAIEIAMANAELAGVDDTISFEVQDASHLTSDLEYGYIISNPPYGERMSDKENVKKLYEMMGRIYGKFDTWSKYIFTAHEDFENCFGKKATKNRKLYNGKIKSYLYQYFGPRPPRNK